MVVEDAGLGTLDAGGGCAMTLDLDILRLESGVLRLPREPLAIVFRRHNARLYRVFAYVPETR